MAMVMVVVVEEFKVRLWWPKSINMLALAV